MNMMRRDWLLLASAAASRLTLGCASDTEETARLVLPNFNLQDFDDRRILFTPYPLHLGNKGYLPLTRDLRRELSARYSEPDSQLAALEAFAGAGVEAARAQLAENRLRLKVVTIEPAHWRQYWDAVDSFFPVSLDGVHQYRIPKQETLAPFDADAEYALAFGPVGYSRFSSQSRAGTKNNRYYVVTNLFCCDSSFLIWDYRKARPIAQGKLDLSVRLLDDVTLEAFQELGATVGSEVFDKPPFTKA